MKNNVVITRFIASFILKHKKGMLLYFSILIPSALISNIEPFLYKSFVDIMTGKNITSNVSLLYYIVFGIAAVQFISGILNEFAIYFYDRGFAINSLNEIRLHIFSYLQHLSFNFHQNKKSGSVISMMNRGQNAIDVYMQSLLFNIVLFLIDLIFLLVTLSFINVKLMIILLLTVILYIVSSMYLLKENLEKRAVFNKTDDAIKAVIADNLINYETVKLYRQEDYEKERLGSESFQWKKDLLSYANTYRKFGVVFTIITSLSLWVSLFLSLQDTIAKIITIGTFVLILSFLTRLYGNLENIFYEFRNIVKNFSDMESYVKILDNPIEIRDPEQPKIIDNLNGSVEFQHVTFCYKGRQAILKDVSFTANPNQTVALVGKSGAGKSTISKLLLRLYDVDEGIITIDNINIKDLNQKDLKDIIGLVPQEPALFNNTIKYNIAYPKPESSLDTVKKAAQIASLDEFIETLPDKYETEVGERGIKLSGGQKQRLAIARTIIQDPKIIIFDEATSHLDSESESYIQESLKSISNDKTVILIAHRLSTIMHADKIIVFENGEIADIGTHESLIEGDSTLYKRLWTLQSEGKL